MKRTGMKNKKLKKDHKSLPEANKGLLNWTKVSGNRHLAIMMEKLIATISIHLLGIAIGGGQKHFTMGRKRNKRASEIHKTYH